jgi:hypothetical protein
MMFGLFLVLCMQLSNGYFVHTDSTSSLHQKRKSTDLVGAITTEQIWALSFSQNNNKEIWVFSFDSAAASSTHSSQKRRARKRWVPASPLQ